MKKEISRAFKLSVGICAIGASLSGCFTIEPLVPGAQNVVVSDGTNLGQCKKLGHVEATDTNGVSVAYSSHEELQQSQTNMLRNQALHLGGNVLVVTDHDTKYLHQDTHAPIDVHTMVGDVYSCPSTVSVHSATSNSMSDLTAEEKSAS